MSDFHADPSVTWTRNMQGAMFQVMSTIGVGAPTMSARVDEDTWQWLVVANGDWTPVYVGSLDACLALDEHYDDLSCPLRRAVVGLYPSAVALAC